MVNGNVDGSPVSDGLAFLLEYASMDVDVDNVFNFGDAFPLWNDNAAV